MPSVAEVTPILYVNNLIEAGRRQWFSYIVGVRADAATGGPWAMAEGAASPGPGEVIIPNVLARKSGIGLGDSVTIMGRPFQVAGLSKETFSMANSITFLPYNELEQLLSTPGAASYFLVKARLGATPGILAEQIRQTVPGVNAMAREAFVASDRSTARQMGVDVIQIMTFIGFIIGVLVMPGPVDSSPVVVESLPEPVVMLSSPGQPVATPIAKNSEIPVRSRSLSFTSVPLPLPRPHAAHAARSRALHAGGGRRAAFTESKHRKPAANDCRGGAHLQNPFPRQSLQLQFRGRAV